MRTVLLPLRRRALSLAIAIGAFAGLSSIAGSPSASAVVAPTPDVGSGVSVSETALQAIQDAITAHPQAFVGLSWESANDVTVHLAGSDTAGAVQLVSTLVASTSHRRDATPQTYHVTFKVEKTSLRDLQAIADAVPTLPLFASKYPGRLTSWTVSPATDKLAIGVTSDVADISTALQQAYGDKVSVFQQGPASNGGRTNDAQAFYGGDRLNLPGFMCSTGFGITIAAHQYTLTDGHCYNDAGTTAGSNINGVSLTDVVSHYASGGADTARAGVRSFGAYAWIGGVNTTTSSNVTGTLQGAGHYVCASGAVYGEHCNGYVTDGTQGCVTLDGHNTCYLVHVSDPGGLDTTCKGDSGGPVYIYNGPGNTGSLSAVGIFVGGVKDVSNPTCFTDFWYTPITYLLSHWAATLNTSP